MERSGASLKKIRLEKGISLEEAHKKTKIHSDILRAIEEDDFINLSPVYVKGFLKIYSNFLGVDPRDYTPVSKDAKATSRISPAKEEPENKVLDDSGLKTVWPHSETSKKIIRITFIIIVVITALNILFNLGRILAQKLSLIRARRTAISAAKKEDKAVAATVKNSATATSTKAKTSSPPPVSKEKVTASGIRLVIRARENSWMQVKIDGRVIFQNILKKGRSESWEAKEKIELSLGNAGVLDLEINSKLIPSLGRRGQSLKNILITKDGLSVKR